jgi:hypothetical protein
MGINTPHAGQRNLTPVGPNFTVVNKLMINARYIKLPNHVSLDQTNLAARRKLGEMREDWVEILLDAGKPLPDPRLRIPELPHINV